MPKQKGFCDLGFAKVDLDRKRRRGFAEAIYCPGKTKENISKISLRLLSKNQDLLLTKLDKKVFEYLKRKIAGLKYNSLARIGYLSKNPKILKKGLIVVASAGTSDIPVAEEAAITSEFMGNRVTRLYDVGVAGVHRILEHSDLLKKAKVIIVVAGMDGALPSLVSGLCRAPVIAVPTSCGYGASFNGLSALLAMLNSCSPGIVTVNINNGFGAGYFASIINQ
jgi:hypothetical protein